MLLSLFVLDERFKKFAPGIIDEKLIHKAINFRMRSWDRLLNKDNWPTVEAQGLARESFAHREVTVEVDNPWGSHCPQMCLWGLNL